MRLTFNVRTYTMKSIFQEGSEEDTVTVQGELTF